MVKLGVVWSGDKAGDQVRGDAAVNLGPHNGRDRTSPIAGQPRETGVVGVRARGAHGGPGRGGRK